VALSSSPPDPGPILAELGVREAVVTAVAGGWDTSLWRVQAGGQSYALRVFRPEQDSVWRREALVMPHLADAGLPVPRVHAATIASGRPALLLSWCEGRALLDQLRGRPWSVWQLATAMGRMHARIHVVPVSDVLANGLPVWAPRVEDADLQLQPQLETNRDASAAVLHLDYHPLNILIDGRTITCVLDWANVAVGDRRADLARTITLLRLAPLPPGPAAMLTGVLRRVLEAGWRRGYLQYWPADSFAALDPFYVWAGRMMERDLRPKLGRPGVWLTESDLGRIHRWTNVYARRTRS
jgi:aminoglycoside phosphotransferase (APT) family kinase protein